MAGRIDSILWKDPKIGENTEATWWVAYDRQKKQGVAVGAISEDPMSLGLAEERMVRYLNSLPNPSLDVITIGIFKGWAMNDITEESIPDAVRSAAQAISVEYLYLEEEAYNGFNLTRYCESQGLKEPLMMADYYKDEVERILRSNPIHRSNEAYGGFPTEPGSALEDGRVEPPALTGGMSWSELENTPVYAERFEERRVVGRYPEYAFLDHWESQRHPEWAGEWTRMMLASGAADSFIALHLQDYQRFCVERFRETPGLSTLQKAVFAMLNNEPISGLYPAEEHELLSQFPVLISKGLLRCDGLLDEKSRTEKKAERKERLSEPRPRGRRR